jgi:DNA-binding PadR family transcriptional regulator
MHDHSHLFGHHFHWRGRGGEPPEGPVDPRAAHFGGRQGGGRGGGGRSPFGFGPGGGFPFGGFPWPFPRGRGAQRARRGDVRAGILALLAESPRNGYQIMQELEERSGGRWRPSPGSVYPALQQLEDEGLVRAEEAGNGRLFQLTDQGRAYVKEHAEETAAPWDWAKNEGDDDVVELFSQIRHIGGALWQIAQSGEPAHIAQARKVLSDARRALYRILSEDPEAEPETDDE